MSKYTHLLAIRQHATGALNMVLSLSKMYYDVSTMKELLTKDSMGWAFGTVESRLAEGYPAEPEGLCDQQIAGLEDAYQTGLRSWRDFYTKVFKSDERTSITILDVKKSQLGPGSIEAKVTPFYGTMSETHVAMHVDEAKSFIVTPYFIDKTEETIIELGEQFGYAALHAGGTALRSTAGLPVLWRDTNWNARQYVESRRSLNSMLRRSNTMLRTLLDAAVDANLNPDLADRAQAWRADFAPLALVTA